MFGDSIHTQIMSLSAKELSGLELKHFGADVVFCSSGIYLDGLEELLYEIAVGSKGEFGPKERAMGINTSFLGKSIIVNRFVSNPNKYQGSLPVLIQLRLRRFSYRMPS